MNVDNSFSTIDIAVSGLKAQEKNIALISSNVANAQSTDDGTGKPYRRVEAVLKANENGLGGVSIEKIATDMSTLQKILRPGNPNADEQGYVEMPNVSLPMEMANLNMATKTYQANAAILKRYQNMIETTLELLR